ncbi:MAG TPA: methylmalonyl-CoA epimerase [Gemmatimonadales bacterium]|jgi:methylmalonyl-CoA/ethylmalonyl-CoA epimerase|nr:methylmalonyl-CoA epimerase [Gemmatimonadales bacterium]
MDEPRLAHVGVAVTSLAEALPFYRDVLGLVPGHPETADGASIVSLHFGDVDVELLEPIDPASPVAKFLARRGPGIHHVCYRVPDLDAALARCRKAGYRLIDETPRRGAGGRRIAFLHPKATNGILLELTE